MDMDITVMKVTAYGCLVSFESLKGQLRGIFMAQSDFAVLGIKCTQIKVNRV